MEYGYTVYTVSDDINMIAGDTITKSFLVYDRDGNPVNLGGSGGTITSTITATFCRYGESDKPIIMTPPTGKSIINKSTTIENQFSMTLYPINTDPTTAYTNSVDPYKDTYLQYQISITDFKGTQRSRVYGKISIKAKAKKGD